MKTFQSLQLIKKQSHFIPPKISIGIRVKDEIDSICYFWESIENQTCFQYFEIIFLDSGSKDGTIEFIKKLNCNLYAIHPDEFSFGETCNLIMSLSNCEHVCFFSGHVILESETMMQNVINFLNKNFDASGYFRQTINQKVGYTTYDRTFLKYRYPIHKNTEPLLMLSEKNGFSNAASIVYKKHWDIIKFKDVAASEDYFWAKEAIEKKMNIYYFQMLNVQHSHKESLNSVYNRVRINAKSRYPDGVNLLKFITIFAKVFFAIFINTGNIIDSFRFAKAHSYAYRNLNKV